MTLRLRLVVGLVILVTAGLAVFGVTTYQLYSRAQYDRLDKQLQGSATLVAAQLLEDAGIDKPSGADRRGGPGGRGRPPVYLPPSTYAELRDEDGAILQQTNSPGSDTAVPALDDVIRAGGTASRFFDAGSVSGDGDEADGRWRVLVTSSPGYDRGTLVLAVPLTEVTDALHRLVLIEAGAAAGLLALLAAGSWLILRRGLRPLEAMAGSARSISAGDLSHRVAPADSVSEVGQLGLALNTMLDEIEAAFREREATEQRLRQFLADASHELRTPLTSIQGFAELFRLGAAGGDDESAHVNLEVILRRIEQESARMKTLVEDLLLLARLDQTRAIESAPVDLAVLAADACSDAVAAAPDRPVTLDAPEPVVVAGDRDHLRQAIANLVTNALRHTPPGTPIEVSASARDGVASVAVRDHGGGLSAEALDHVFDRFWQADRARAGSGAGLGLSIVAGIAAEHGGRAEAANHPGGGAVFTVTVPRA